MAGQEVRVGLGLDTTAADAALAAFFSKIKGQKLDNPFQNFGDDFDKVEKSAKALGLTWDAVAKKFKNNIGESFKTDTVVSALKQLDATAKASGKSLDAVASEYRGFAGTLDFTGKKVAGFGQTLASAKTSISGLNLGPVSQQIKQIGQEGTAAGKGIATLATGAGQASAGLRSTAQDATGTASKFGGLTDAATKTSGALKGIGGGNDGLSKLAKDANATEAELKQTAEAAVRLDSAVKGAGKTSALPALKSTLGGVKAEATAATAQFGPLAGAITKAGSSSDKLSAIPKALQAGIAPGQQLSKVIKQVGNDTDEAGKKVGRFSSALRDGFKNVVDGIPQGIGLAIGNLVLAPILALGQAIPAALKEFADLDAGIRLTLAIAGEAPDKFGALQDVILSVGAASAATTQEVSEVAKSLAAAGFNLEQIAAATGPIVQGAEATGTAYATMGDIVASAIGQFKLSAADAGDIVDTLVVGANAANQSVSDMGEALKYVGPVAYSTGQSLQDVTLALGLLSNAGIKGSTAGTSLRTLLTNLQIAASGASSEFTDLSRGSEKLGGALRLIGADVTGANGALKTGKDLVYSLQDAFAGLSRGETAIISKALAGAEGLPTLNTLINATGQEVEQLATDLDQRFGTAARNQADATAGWSGALRNLNGALSTALANVGGFLAAGLTPLVQALTLVINALSGLPGPIKTAVLALALLGTGVGVATLAMKLFAMETGTALGAAVVQRVTALAAAFTAANVGATLRIWTNAAMAFGAVVSGQMIAGLGSATSLMNKFNAAVLFSTSGLKSAGTWLKGVVSGFSAAGNVAGAAASGVASVAKASADATGALTMMTKAGVVAAPWMATIGTTAPVAASGVAAAGAASGAAAGGFGALTASLGAFLIAAAPVVLIVAAAVAVFALLKTTYDSATNVSNALVKSQDKLTDSLKKPSESAKEQAKTVDVLGVGYRSWGKAIVDFMGPFDEFLTKFFPLYAVFKLTAEALGRVVDAMKDAAGTKAATDAQAAFGAALAQSKSRIDDNVEAMKKLKPASAEYAKLANENVRLERTQVTATEERIATIDKLVQELGRAPEANAGQIAALNAERNSLAQLLPQMRLRLDALAADAKAARAAAGANADLGRTLGDVAADRAKAYSSIDSTAYLQELKSISDLKDGLINESEQRMISAKIAVDSAQARLNADEAALAESKQLLDQGTITQAAYDQKLSEFTEKHKERLVERAQAEIALKAAIAAAIDARLQEYEREQQQIVANVQRVNQALSEIGSIGTAGISAFKALGDSIAAYELGIIDRNKSARLKSIDETGAAQKAAISSSGMDEQQKAQATANLEANLAAQKAAAEEQYAAEKRAIIAQQLELELASIEATKNAKLAELEIWKVEKAITTEMAMIQNEIARVKAEQAGDTRLLAALQAEAGLLQAQKGLIVDAYGLKQQIIGIETETAKVAVANKAAQEGVGSAIAGQVGSIGSVKAEMEGFNQKVEGLTEKWMAVGNGVGFVENRVTEVAASTTAKMNKSFADIDPSTAAKIIADTKFVGPETTKQLAEGITGGMVQGATEGSTQAAGTIATNLGGAPVAEPLATGIQQGITTGADAGTVAATAKVATIGDAVPYATMEQKLTSTFKNPVDFLTNALKTLTPAGGILTFFQGLASIAGSIAKSGLARELQAGQGAGAKLQTSTNAVVGNITRAISPAIRLAQALERAARAAAATNTGRWAGGPVAGGSVYEVNELGREMFLSKSGGLSEINAPAFGKWRAPSSGTVIPASISEQIRKGAKSQEIAASLGGSGGGRGSTGGMTILQQESGGLQRQLIREIRKLDGGAGGNQVNNIQITSERPVNDASKMLIDLARRRALRRF